MPDTLPLPADVAALLDPLIEVPDPGAVGHFPLFIPPASHDAGESTRQWFRIPVEWLAAIDRIREAPGTNLPDYFPNRSLFYRWCVGEGFRTLRKLAKEANATEGWQPLDGMLQMLLANEELKGRSEMRARLIINAQASAQSVIEGVRVLLRSEQAVQAANELNDWADTVAGVEDEYWGTVHAGAMLGDMDNKAVVGELIRKGLITNQWLLEAAVVHGVISQVPGDYREEERDV